MRKVIISFGMLISLSAGIFTASAEEVSDEQIMTPELPTVGASLDQELNIDDVDIEGLLESLKPNERLITERAKSVGLSATCHVKSYGWQQETKTADVIFLGSTGKGLRLEAMQLYFWQNGKRAGNINYRSHVQTLGWLGYAKNGNHSGTTGKGLRMEALNIHLSGSKTKGYSVKYRAHIAKKGWLGWADAGSEAGTTGQKLQIEAVQIALVAKA